MLPFFFSANHKRILLHISRVFRTIPPRGIPCAFRSRIRKNAGLARGSPHSCECGYGRHSAQRDPDHVLAKVVRSLFRLHRLRCLCQRRRRLQRWTDPAVVREQVIRKLEAMYPGRDDHHRPGPACASSAASVSASSHVPARRSQRGRVLPRPLRHHLSRQGKNPQGLLTIRKIELYRPRLHAVRNRDGPGAWKGHPGRQKPTATLCPRWSFTRARCKSKIASRTCRPRCWNSAT